MSSPTSNSFDSMVSLWRYPVKSMMGEELNSAVVGDRGLLGDRAFALVDDESGQVVSAKNPKKWPGFFFFRAAYVEPLQSESELPAVRITFPDGKIVRSDQPDINQELSHALPRPVSLKTQAPAIPIIEQYHPD